MSFSYQNTGSLWNTAASYFPAAAKYCQDNNISLATAGNVAKELAVITVTGPLAVAHETGKAAMTAVLGSVVNAIPDWTFSAKDSVLQTAHAALATTHAWHFGGDSAKEAGSATLVQELALAAGGEALRLGQQAFASACTLVSTEAVEWQEDWTAALTEAQVLLRGPHLFPGVDAAVVAAEVFSWDEDGDMLPAAHGFANDSAATQRFVPAGQEPPAARGDYAMEDAPLHWSAVDFAGVSAAEPVL